MHHPGPPWFVHVGEPVTLRPARTGSGRIVRLATPATRPPTATSPSATGWSFTWHPTSLGTYRLELDAPDGTTARRSGRSRTHGNPPGSAWTRNDVDGDISAAETASVIGQFNDFTMGVDRATREWTATGSSTSNSRRATTRASSPSTTRSDRSPVRRSPSRDRADRESDSTDDVKGRCRWCLPLRTCPGRKTPTSSSTSTAATTTCPKPTSPSRAMNCVSPSRCAV